MKKKTLKALTAILSCFLVVSTVAIVNFSSLTVKASGEAWLNGYTHRKQLSISNASGAGTNYVVPVNLNNGYGVDSGNLLYLNGSAMSFPNDVRFTDSDGSTLLYQWLDTDLGTYGWLSKPYLTSSNPLFTANNTYDSNGDFEPVLYKDNSVYYLFYTAINGSSVWQTALANSTDLVHWNQMGVILSPSKKGYDDVCVDPMGIYKADNGTYFLYYAMCATEKNNVITAPLTNGLATSQNIAGPYTPYSGNPINITGGPNPSSNIGPSIILKYDSNTYIGFGDGGSNDVWQVPSFFSNDLVNWTYGQVVLDNNFVEGPRLFTIGSAYYLIVNYIQSGLATQQWVYVNTTSTLSAWQFAGVLLGPNGDSGAWDSAAIGPSSCIYENGALTVIYPAAPDTGFWNYKIGSATYYPASAVYWVKIPENLNSANATIYMYYGKNSDSIRSDGSNVFTFFDNDTGKLTDKWTVVSGSWSYSAGKLVETGTGSASGDFLTCKTFVPTNVQIHGVIQYSSTRWQALASLAVRWTDSSNYFFVTTRPADSVANQFSIWKNNSDGNSSISGLQYDYSASNTYVLTASCYGNVISGDINGTKVTVTNSSHPIGSIFQIVGTQQTSGQKIFYQNVWARSYVQTEPSITILATDSISVIVSSADAHSTITPSGAVSVNYGADQSFSFSASKGYSLTQVLVDGSPVSLSSPYTFSNVQANHTISVSTSIDVFYITSSPLMAGIVVFIILLAVALLVKRKRHNLKSNKSLVLTVQDG